MALLFEDFGDGDAGVKMAARATTGDQDGSFGPCRRWSSCRLRGRSRWGLGGLAVGFLFGHEVGLHLGCPPDFATNDGELVPSQTDALSMDIDEDTQNEAGGK